MYGQGQCGNAGSRQHTCAAAADSRLHVQRNPRQELQRILDEFYPGALHLQKVQEFCVHNTLRVQQQCVLRSAASGPAQCSSFQFLLYFSVFIILFRVLFSFCYPFWNIWYTFQLLFFTTFVVIFSNCYSS